MNEYLIYLSGIFGNIKNRIECIRKARSAIRPTLKIDRKANTIDKREHFFSNERPALLVSRENTKSSLHDGEITEFEALQVRGTACMHMN